MHRTLSSAVCAVLLVIAQFGALTHALWHASGEASEHGGISMPVAAHHAGHAHDGLSHDEQPATQAVLCAFDLAFGQVLGMAHGGGLLPLHVAPATVSIPYVPASRLRAEVLSPKSRGPPVLV